MAPIQPEVTVAEQRKGRERGNPLGGGGPSIVGVSGGMRARDVSRIRPQDDELAAKRLVIRRRPPDPPAKDS